ncbi:uncharacterized protein LOC105847333 isoform X2 [Hydra vulgaris]|uniref:uncharacterized protein LOC105847333 isoform X2 n=1 Tax=Hydra vulgaris TaxID=6087 RepID=UPI001F5EA8DC|nr:uncharacterized protein LOC105847333 isoform X2 [Hydra vulgaris]
MLRNISKEGFKRMNESSHVSELGEFNYNKKLPEEPNSLQVRSRSPESINSSYADLFETSGVEINDYLGSSSQDIVVNHVTYNLNKCKEKVVIPYYRLLCFPAFPILKPNATTINWTNTVPSNNFHLDLSSCRHALSTYIIPDILHFLAFVIGFYYFRVKEHEALYALMEKVYLQSTCPIKMTTSLRIFLASGLLWFLFSLGIMAFSFQAFKNDIFILKNWKSYAVMVLIFLSNALANCVALAVVLSYCGQCKLLVYYLDGVMERLEAKSTELKIAMKDVLAIKSHFNQLNGLFSFSTSCIVFNMIILVLITSVLLIDYQPLQPIEHLIYRICFGIQWTVILLFVLVQAASLTSRSEKLKEKALTIRVFGYQSNTEAEIDSFLNFLNMTRLEAEIFAIPVKSRYLWGILIIMIQSLIIVLQTGPLFNNSKWM